MQGAVPGPATKKKKKGGLKGNERFFVCQRGGNGGVVSKGIGKGEFLTRPAWGDIQQALGR